MPYFSDTRKPWLLFKNHVVWEKEEVEVNKNLSFQRRRGITSKLTANKSSTAWNCKN